MRSKQIPSYLAATLKCNPGLYGLGLMAALYTADAWYSTRVFPAIPGATSLASEMAPYLVCFGLAWTAAVGWLIFKTGSTLWRLAGEARARLDGAPDDAARVAILVEIRYVNEVMLRNRKTALYVSGMSGAELDSWTEGRHVQLSQAEHARLAAREESSRRLAEYNRTTAVKRGALVVTVGLVSALAGMHVASIFFGDEFKWLGLGLPLAPLALFLFPALADARRSAREARYKRLAGIYQKTVQQRDILTTPDLA